MADPKEKRGKMPIPTREPHKKTRTGIFDNLRQLPHPVEEFLSVLAEPRQAPLPPAEALLNEAASDALPLSSDIAVTIESPVNSDSLVNFTSPSISEGLNDPTQTILSGAHSITEKSPSDIEGPANSEGPVKSVSPVKNRPVALQFTGLVKSEGPVKNGGALDDQSPADLATLSFSNKPDFSLLNSLPEVPGYAPAFHQVTDYLYRQLTTAEQAIYGQLYRLTWGYEKPRVTVGFPKLAERANVGESTARAAAKTLENKGLIKRHGVVFGLGHEQGIEWEVFPPSNLVKYLKGREEKKQRGVKSKGPLKSEGPSESEPIKDNMYLKEHTQTQSGVCVSSKFTLEECNRYAEYLKNTGQGINNPGGYATKIFRSGEADALVEEFLNPPAPLDISGCPDCGGTGFIYIDASNRDKGVRHCKHSRLKTGE